MNAYKDYIISPVGSRYNNSVQVGERELIVNTEVFNHQYINRLAKVIATPLLFQSPLKVGDEVIVHHNIFRRWHDVKGREKNSRSYWKEDKYIASGDQIYLYKRKDWIATPGFSFVKPIKSDDKLSSESEKPLVGVIKYSDGTFNKDEVVGFSPNDEFEFVVDNERLYRIMNKYINIKYGRKENQEEYNPSWTQSG
jgi:hypothetical protein